MTLGTAGDDGTHPVSTPRRTRGMDRVYELARRFARSDRPILLLGERGTGKSSFAQTIHALSGRQDPLVVCRLAATPSELQASELLGHVRGAYTGADAARPGRVSAAARGTLFLDELALATAETQALLLGLFDPGGVYQLGSERPVPVTARIIGATNADLDELARNGAFRADLLDRFGFFRITLPPLRERRDEILPIFTHAVTAERGGEPPRIHGDLAQALLAAAWPGNIRQLELVASYVARVADPGEPLTIADLPPEFPELVAGGPPSEEEFLRELARCGGNRSEAARRLGMTRRTVQRWLKRADQSHPWVRRDAPSTRSSGS
ncbi:MAG: sigma-54-dependent Fis family transcriptional regulator [Gemmatimonadetes bacterium]|nr:sigma-54-dependent Fis family transcriptional regulator [Gemmatimonadota bacterium]